jgi:HSP20 family protein
MTMMPIDPWRLIQQWQSELDRLSRHAFHADAATVAGGQWIPSVDIREEPDRFVLYADIPGVEPADIEVTMQDGVLCISGERRIEEPAAGARSRRMERPRGVFHRRFSLPGTADAAGVSASGRMGVLEVVIPKGRKQPARKVQVRS